MILLSHNTNHSAINLLPIHNKNQSNHNSTLLKQNTFIDDLNYFITNPDNNISCNPPIPALAIIGPAKTATTSINEAMMKGDPLMWHQHSKLKENKNKWENTAWVKLTRNIFMKHDKNKIIIHPQLKAFVSDKSDLNHLHIHISDFPFTKLLAWIDPTQLKQYIFMYLQSLWPTGYNQYNYTQEIGKYWYTADKTPQNFYLPHVALIFGYYFSYKNVLKNVRGLKVLCILRDPFQRYQSWFSQNKAGLIHAHDLNNSQKVAAFNETCDIFVNALLDDKSLMHLRYMIQIRKNEYHDTRIMLYWIKYYYGELGGFILHNTFHGLLPSFYYPQLLLYIHFYKQLGLLDGNRRMFKVISFDYLIKNGANAIRLIRCWVQYALEDLEVCLSLVDPNNPEPAFKKLSSKSLSFPVDVQIKLIRFFAPIKVRIAELLLNYPNVVLGDLSDIMLWRDS